MFKKVKVFQHSEIQKSRRNHQLGDHRLKTLFDAAIMAPLDVTVNGSSHNGPVVIMGPINSVCFMFEFDKCSQNGSHHGKDGALQLYICQACYEMRGILVEHSCRGSHGACSNWETGAIACPEGMKFFQHHQSQPTQVPQPLNNPGQDFHSPQAHQLFYQQTFSYNAMHKSSL